MKNVLIPMKIFNEKYGLSKHNTSVFKAKNKTPNVYIGKRKNCMVNETYFLKREAFINKVKQENLDNFYYLAEHLSSSSIARILVAMGSGSENSYAVFLSRGIFTSKTTSILDTTVSKLTWEFWRLSKRIIKAAERLKDKNEHLILLYLKEYNCGTIPQAETPTLGDAVGGYNENYNKTKNK